MVAAHGRRCCRRLRRVRRYQKTVNITDYCKNSRHDATLTCPTSTKSSVAGSAPSPPSSGLYSGITLFTTTAWTSSFLCNHLLVSLPGQTSWSDQLLRPAKPTFLFLIRQVNDAMMG
ncbi:unnamed protein product [Macrosiphum euphorbiae]|uniref:Uncharacterized protein n=1 Tax=Macrosiphum euphorbiae TaxID=13131 RepID=A0AAV0XY70_9HEMI|nr:unnamed protein product [Macrosiphum euphorbiae]